MSHLIVIPLVILLILISLYLYLTPQVISKTPSGEEYVMQNATIESMQSLVSNTDHRMQQIKEDVLLISKIINGIQKDKIACIIPTNDEIKRLTKNTRIVIPESSAFGGGDVMLGHENILRKKNPLLEIVKDRERNIHKLVNAIQLDLDVKGDRFNNRFMKKSIRLKTDIDDMKNKVISGCARQKIRLKTSHPHLSNYSFINESVNSAFISPSNYIHGKSLQPVDRDYQVDESKLGLMHEFASA